MKHSNPKSLLLLFLSILTLLLGGCQSAETSKAIAPFSDATWEYTRDDILSYEGENYTTYDSVYGGICYTYPKTYENYQGTIKYMLDEEDRLMCIAWAYSSEDEEELYSLYEFISQSVYEQNGDTAYETDKPTNYGNVWRREEGNIILSTMITSDLKALQYAYLHPDVSNNKEE